MKKRIVILTLSFLVLLCAACGNKGKKTEDSAKFFSKSFGSPGGDFTITGKLQNASNLTLYLEEMTPDNGAQFIDSIKCDQDGNFKYNGNMPYQTFYNLHSSEYDYIVLLPKAGEEIRISGDTKKLNETYTVSGSYESQLVWQILQHINNTNLVIADIAQQDKYNKAKLSDEQYETAHKQTNSIFLIEREKTIINFKKFINDNLGSLSTLYAIDAPFNHGSRVFYAETDPDMFEIVLEGLQSTQPDNPHVQYFKLRVDRIRSARMMAQQQQTEPQIIIN